MKRIFVFIAINLALLPRSQAVEIVHWERLPLAIALIENQERVVFVERNVRVGVPSELRERLRVQSAGGALYFLAREPINPTRIQLQDIETGDLILLDITAEPGAADQAPLEPLRIVSNEATTRVAEAPNSREEQAKKTPIPVILTQYAAQSMYAPLRTIDPVNAIVPVSVDPDPLDTLLPHLSVSAKALGAWRLDDLWVTAVKLTNTGTQPLLLDPRALQGNFVAATFQHRDLGPAGDSTDTTTVYLVTRGYGVAGTLIPNFSAIDAAAGGPDQEPSRN